MPIYSFIGACTRFGLSAAPAPSQRYPHVFYRAGLLAALFAPHHSHPTTTETRHQRTTSQCDRAPAARRMRRAARRPACKYSDYGGMRSFLDMRRRHDGYLESQMHTSDIAYLQDVLWPIDKREQNRLQEEMELVVNEVKRVL